jgi:hypothetical protein
MSRVHIIAVAPPPKFRLHNPCYEGPPITEESVKGLFAAREDFPFLNPRYTRVEDIVATVRQVADRQTVVVLDDWAPAGLPDDAQRLSAWLREQSRGEADADALLETLIQDPRSCASARPFHDAFVTAYPDDRPIESTRDVYLKVLSRSAWHACLVALLNRTRLPAMLEPCRMSTWLTHLAGIAAGMFAMTAGDREPGEPLPLSFGAFLSFMCLRLNLHEQAHRIRGEILAALTQRLLGGPGDPNIIFIRPYPTAVGLAEGLGRLRIVPVIHNLAPEGSTVAYDDWRTAGCPGGRTIGDAHLALRHYLQVAFGPSPKEIGAWIRGLSPELVEEWTRDVFCAPIGETEPDNPFHSLAVRTMSWAIDKDLGGLLRETPPSHPTLSEIPPDAVGKALIELLS